jgi:8-oxo-dGTP pyrophosphatase MutT (NUDIX family)
MVEAGETLVDAALREAHEEVGIDPSTVTVRGTLTPIHIPVSGFTLYPVVGTAAARPALKAEENEVARVLEVAVGDVLDPARQMRTHRMRDGADYEVPYFDLDGEAVWGATAMVLAEFAAWLGHAPDPWREQVC